MPKDVVFRSLDLDQENDEVDEEEMEEVWGRRDKGGVEELGLVACCMRQWILNQLDRRPYLDTWGMGMHVKQYTHTHILYMSDQQQFVQDNLARVFVVPGS